MSRRVMSGLEIYAEINAADLFENPPPRYQDLWLDVTVNYEIHPGYPASGPSYYSGGSPEEPPSIEIVSVTSNTDEPLTAELEDAVLEYVYNQYEEKMFDNARDYCEDRPDRDEY